MVLSIVVIGLKLCRILFSLLLLFCVFSVSLLDSGHIYDNTFIIYNIINTTYSIFFKNSYYYYMHNVTIIPYTLYLN